jgi:sterol desaturase/sphingolipid hydroxylase (fatty acid hydroxylase superfamily)
LQSLWIYFIHNSNLIQLTLFGGVISALWLVETKIDSLSTALKFKHTQVNSLFILSALPIQFLFAVITLSAARLAAHHHWGLVYFLPNADAPVIKYGLMFIALDFLDYVYHRTMHYVPALWRLHLLHHTDRAVDVSTTLREHPCETIIRNGFLVFWIFLCGASIEIVMIRQAAETVMNISSHTSLRLPRRIANVLGLLFITPNLHHAHHHYQLPATNKNFGDVFSIWDRLFGTFIDLPKHRTVFGLDTHMNGQIDHRISGYLMTLSGVFRSR